MLAHVLAVGMVAAILSATVPSRAASPPATAAPPGATAEELLELVRDFNPNLAAAALDSEQAAAKIVPAGALDDPTLNLSRDQGFRQTLVSISQDFALWGKRGLRTDVATADADASRARERSVGKDLEERVKVTFAQYYEADHAIRVTQDIHDLLHAVSGTVRERYAQGLVNQSDAIRAELEQTRLGLALSALEEADQTAKAKINALIARRADAPLARPLVLRKPPSTASLSLDALMVQARDRNPMLAASRAEITGAEGERQLADKAWYPDVSVSVGVDALPNQAIQPMVGLGIKIPFYQSDVRRAQTRAATAKKGSAQLRLDGALLQIESELRSALAMLHRTERTEDLIKTALNQQSETAYRSALASYQLGRGDLTPVLEAAHQQLEIRLELLRVETEAQTALAAIERLVGGDL
jgi:outer membrane protein TolC